MSTSWARNLILAGCLSLTIPPSGDAAPVLVPLPIPTLTSSGIITLNLETQTFGFNEYVAGYDITFQTDGSGNPFSIIGSDANISSFCMTFGNLGLLKPGVAVDSNLVANNPGSNFQQYAYFSPAPGAGTYYVGFQTTLDLDQDPLTLGTTYGFFEVTVGSLDVVGFGFESTPGLAAVTAPVPEPMVSGLLALAAGAAVLFRRRKSAR